MEPDDQPPAPEPVDGTHPAGLAASDGAGHIGWAGHIGLGWPQQTARAGGTANPIRRPPPRNRNDRPPCPCSNHGTGCPRW